MYRHIRFAFIKCSFHKGINFFDPLICHRITPYRYTIAMHHQKTAASAVCTVVFVRKTKIKCKMEFT